METEWIKHLFQRDIFYPPYSLGKLIEWKLAPFLANFPVASRILPTR